MSCKLLHPAPISHTPCHTRSDALPSPLSAPSRHATLVCNGLQSP